MGIAAGVIGPFVSQLDVVEVGHLAAFASRIGGAAGAHIVADIGGAVVAKVVIVGRAIDGQGLREPGISEHGR